MRPVGKGFIAGIDKAINQIHQNALRKKYEKDLQEQRLKLEEDWADVGNIFGLVGTPKPDGAEGETYTHPEVFHMALQKYPSLVAGMANPSTVGRVLVPPEQKEPRAYTPGTMLKTPEGFEEVPFPAPDPNVPPEMQGYNKPTKPDYTIPKEWLDYNMARLKSLASQRENALQMGDDVQAQILAGQEAALYDMMDNYFTQTGQIPQEVSAPKMDAEPDEAVALGGKVPPEMNPHYVNFRIQTELEDSPENRDLFARYLEWLRKHNLTNSEKLMKHYVQHKRGE